MITIFTVPKAFEGEMAVMQENAIKSWQMMKPKPEIILYGNDPGVREAAKKLKVRHVPNIKCNKYDTPMLDSIFADADKRAKNEILCYINTDIVFISDFTGIIKKIPFKNFLVIGRRYDVKVRKPINFSDADWKKKLYDYLVKKGSFLTMGMDYFIYKKGLYSNMPEFAIGRGSWDSWMVYNAIQKKADIIDASNAIIAVHENHDYSHLKSAPGNQYWKGEEAEKNLKLSGFKKARPPNFYDAGYVCSQQGIKPARGFIHVSQKIYDFSTRHKALLPLYVPIKLARKLGPLVHKFKKPRPAFGQRK